MIRVVYDGKYPSTCMGRLIIYDGEIEIYNKEYCCSSSGRVWFDNDWGAHIECGELTWNETEASKFPREVQDAVASILSEKNVCCGGCI